MGDQTAKLKCWKCKDIFHMRIRREEGHSFGKVAVIRPCPYCGAQCRVVLRESQMISGKIYRGSGGNEADAHWFDGLKDGALVDVVFDSENEAS